MTSTVAYLRVSTETQAEAGHGLEAQRAACVAWAVQNGVEIDDFYTDVASGARSDREQLGVLKEAVAKGTVSKLLVYAVDRLGRDLIDTEGTIRLFQQQRCEVISVTQYFEENAAGKMLRQLLLVFAEYERALLKARLAGGRKAAKAKGRWQGGVAPYGFRSVGDGKLEAIEIEMKTVRDVLSAIDAGSSLRETRSLLHTELAISTLAKIVKRRDLYIPHLSV